MSRCNKQHNGLAIRHPALRNIDSMELIAVAELHQSAPTKEYKKITPSIEMQIAPRMRRYKRLTPALKPICPSDYF